MNSSRQRLAGLVPAAPEPAAGSPPEPSRDALLLDIGGQTGALAIYAGAGRDGAEIEISPARDSRARSHNVVRARRAGRVTHYAAVFPALPAGDYTVWADDVTPAGTVTIEGGRVAEFRL
jgi:hypothetical protein